MQQANRFVVVGVWSNPEQMRVSYKSMSREEKERLKELIEKLDDNEQIQVFQVVRKYTRDFTRTETGVFVSMDILPLQCLQEIQTYIRFCADQKKSNDEHMRLRKQYEQMMKA